MANPSKAKGTAAETAVVRYLRDHGYPRAERLALHGGKDIGDIRACPGFILEVKNHKTVTDGDIVVWQDETTRERLNGHADLAFLVVARPYKNVANWWAWRQIGGAWYCTWLNVAVINARDEGWGDPV